MEDLIRTVPENCAVDGPERNTLAPAKPKPFSHQIDCLNDSIKKLETNISIYNTAPTGAGKTCIAFMIAEARNSKIFVVAPPVVLKDWEKKSKEYGSDMIGISYDLLLGKGAKCNHPYLVKENSVDDCAGYAPTKELHDLIDKGTIFVFDEVDESKNPDTQRLAACHTITKTIVSSRNNSRILLMSATLIDKKKYAESILKLLGIIKRDQLIKYFPGTRRYDSKNSGYDEVYNYCMSINPEETKRLVPSRLSAKAIKDSTYDMLCKVIKDRIGTSMPKARLDVKFYPEIRYYSTDTLRKYSIEDTQVDEIKRRVSSLRNTMITIGSKITRMKDPPGAIMMYLHHIENGMLTLLTKILYDKLLKFPDRKFIIYVWFDSSVDYLMATFSKFKPLRCDGQTKKNDKSINVDLFQRADTEYRLIFAKPTSFSKGINLDDTDGRFPRETICIPNFYFGLIHQAAGRTCRSLTKSNSYFSLIFIKDADILDILKSLHEKSTVSYDAIIDKCDVDNKIIYPSEYPIVYDEENSHLEN